MPSDEDYAAMAAGREKIQAVCLNDCCGMSFYTIEAAENHLKET